MFVFEMAPTPKTSPQPQNNALKKQFLVMFS
jgi:hypothetical protein